MLSDKIKLVAKEIVGLNTKKYMGLVSKYLKDIERNTRKSGTIAWLIHDWSNIEPQPFRGSQFADSSVGGYFTFNLNGKNYSGGFGDSQEDIKSAEKFDMIVDDPAEFIENEEGTLEQYIESLGGGSATFKDLNELVDKIDDLGSSNIEDWVDLQKEPYLPGMTAKRKIAAKPMTIKQVIAELNNASIKDLGLDASLSGKQLIITDVVHHSAGTATLVVSDI